jgi:branched-chain amino acid transport system permease protein
MSVELFAQILVNGLMSGGMYALIASGFTLILGVLQVFNFAQGHFYMLGAYLTFWITVSLGIPYPIAIVITFVAMALLGILFYFGVLQWTIPSGFFHTMLVCVAFANIVMQVGILSFGFNERVVPPVVSGTLDVAGISINSGKLIVIGGAIIVMVALYYFMKSKMGTAIQSASENREVAGLQGINSRQVFWITMAVGCGLCGIAGALIVPVLSASSSMGTNAFAKAMLVVMIGGTGSMGGALMAAFIVGIIESFAFQYVGQLSVLVLFVFVAILLFFRPGGLLGKPLPIPGQ